MALALAALLLLAGARAQNTTCTSSRWCGPGRECVANQCRERAACDPDAEGSCAEGWLCVTTPDSETTQCMRSCSNAFDCELGEACVRPGGYSGPSVCMVACQVDDDCAGDSRCFGRLSSLTYCKAACSPDVTTDCKEGHVCQDGTCQPAPCDFGADDDDTSAQTCPSGICTPSGCQPAGCILDGKVCSETGECMAGAACRCPDPYMNTRCSGCLQGYSLSADETRCVPNGCGSSAPANCATCTTSTGSSCLRCADGFTSTRDQCIFTCPGNCAICDNNGKCVTCAEGYASPPLCYPEENCPPTAEYANCLLCAGETCTTCRPGFTDPDGGCQAKCSDLSRTYMCQPDDPSAGFICRTGNSPLCHPMCNGCSAYSPYSNIACTLEGVCAERGCLTVVEGFTDVYHSCAGHGTCVDGACSCETGSNLDAASRCQNCLPGFVRDNSGACVRAPEGCPETCATCQDGKCLTCPLGKSRPDLDCTVSCAQVNCVRCRPDDEFFCELCNITSTYDSAQGLCAAVCDPPCQRSATSQQDCAIQNGRAVCLPQGCVSTSSTTGVSVACSNLGVCNETDGTCVNCAGLGPTLGACGCVHNYQTVAPEDPDASLRLVRNSHCNYYNCSSSNIVCQNGPEGDEGDSCDAASGECRCDKGWAPPTCSDCASGFFFNETGGDLVTTSRCDVNVTARPDCTTAYYGNNCAACTAEDGCTTCRDGADPVGGRCMASGAAAGCSGAQTAAGCTACDADGLCTACSEGLVLDETAPEVSCVAPDSCTGVKALAIVGLERRCVYNCTSLENAPGCLQCTAAACLLCSRGFEVVSWGCEACTHGVGNGIACTACPAGSRPNADHTACVPEECTGAAGAAGCAGCSSSAPAACSRCVEGFLENRTSGELVCEPEPGCVWPMRVVGRTCEQAPCAEVKDCAGCATDDPTQCGICSDGSRPSGNVCGRKPSGSALTPGAIAGIVVAAVVVVAVVVAVVTVVMCRKKKASAVA